MKIFVKNIILVLLFVGSVSYGQISPGDLSQSHADIEGMTKCTQCHELGEKVSNSKCLECHTEIRSLIDSNSGYHANSKFINKDCFECHSDHHGRKFDMIRFDENSFDHSLAGYKLEGKHATVDCRDCHNPDNIKNSKIKQRKNTFLGMDQECLSCHADFHQGTLPKDCLSCHTMEAFIPVTKFDHNTAEFQLKGKHTTVDCIECHKMTTRNGVEFQEFTDIPFADCKSCHQDPHKNNLPGNCMQCHSETSFSTFNGKELFNHGLTSFDLKGKHQQVDCFSCHDKTTNPVAIFQDKIVAEENNCVACHQDEHEGKYSNDCAKCHNESSFLSLNNMDFFDHTVTDYALEGKHLEVDCRECHVDRFSTPIDFSSCNNCHSDYHNGEFLENGLSPDCVECHSLENGFDYSLYTMEQHQTISFPLEGAHTATPCFSCHISEDDERWTFRNIGSTCIDCHTDFHEGFISSTYYPEKDCKSCHGNASWDVVNFDHSQTNWELSGKHQVVNCKECHFEITGSENVISQKFSNLDTQCASCHENIHDDAFAIDGVTDCNRCHVSDSWFPKKFDHNSTAFPLEGQHAEIECSACHQVSDNSTEALVVYKLNKLECIDCHQ